MTSMLRGPKQSGGHYIILPAANGDGFFSTQTILAYSGETGSGGSSMPGTFSTAGWAEYAANGAQSTMLKALIGPNKLLKDMGKTVVSSLRVFRKVAAVSSIAGNPYSSAANTETSFGVVINPTTGEQYVGYVEMGYEGFGTPARVARYDNL
jgi:hypothetical protein